MAKASTMVNRGVQILVLIGLGSFFWGSSRLVLYPEQPTSGYAMGLGLSLLISTVVVWLRSRPQDQLWVQPETWTLERQPEHYRLQAIFVAQNLNPLLEVTLADISLRHHLLSQGSIDAFKTRLQLKSKHSDQPPRQDNYWQAYIISPQDQTRFEVELEITGPDLEQLDSCWLEVDYIQYGRQARTPKTSHLIVPLREVAPLQDPQWQPREACDLVPIPTHLLNPSDQLQAVIERYITPIGQPGDVVVVSESALAVIQGQLRHPRDVHRGWVAQTLCYAFPSKTSLSSSYGLQVLIDTSNVWRVVMAFGIGAIAKVLRIPGIFYALAGEQASLIDDVTGSLPPYDQFIVLGPHQPQALVDQIKPHIPYELAIADANDLGEVNLLATSSKVPQAIVIEALRKNPAGNSAEQTPIVLIRPKH